MRCRFGLQIVVILLATTFYTPQSNLLAQDGAKDSVKKDPKAAKAAAVEVKQDRMLVYKSMDGRLESLSAIEIESDFEKWTDLKIAMVADQGPVKKGDVLIKFDSESIDKAITEAEFAVKSATFAHQTAKLEAESATKAYELNNTMAEMAWTTAQEDYKYYQEVEVPQRVKDQAYDKKTAAYRLEYANDELDQLQQMYTEDELTEESEAIVLKRAERTVEAAQRGMERTMRYLKRQQDYTNEREDQRRLNSFERAEMAYKKSRITLPIAKEKAEIALAKAKFQLEQKTEALADLQADRKKLELLAPQAGFMFYGKAKRGKWLAGAAGRDLKVDDKVKAKGVIMTIVDNGQLIIRASVAEADIDDFSAGLTGRVKFDSANGKMMKAVIQSVSLVPLADGKYDCKIMFEADETEKLLAGVGCKLSFKVYESESSLIVPKASVFSDNDGFSHYAFMNNEDDEPKKVSVQLGRSSGADVEIVSGLEAGDKIRKKKPSSR